MDRSRTLWIAYLAALGVAGVLIAVADPEPAVSSDGFWRFKFLANATEPDESDASSGSSSSSLTLESHATPEAHERGEPVALLLDEETAAAPPKPSSDVFASLRGVLDSWTAASKTPWLPPPAAQPRSAATVPVVAELRPEFTSGRMRWTAPSRPATPEEGWLGLRVTSRTGEIEHVDVNTPILLARDGGIHVSLWAHPPGFSANRRVTDWRTVPATDLLASGERTVQLSVRRDNNAGEDAAAYEPIPLLLRFEPEAALRPDSPHAPSPTPIEPHVVVSREIHRDDAGAFERLRFPAARRFTVCLVWADADLSHRLECQRTDSDTHVGRFVAGLPLFVAIADGNASLDVMVATVVPDERIAFHAIGWSSAVDPRKELFLEAVSRLPELVVDGGRVSKAGADEAIEQLARLLEPGLDADDFSFLRSSGDIGGRLAAYLASRPGVGAAGSAPRGSPLAEADHLRANGAGLSVRLAECVACFAERDALQDDLTAAATIPEAASAPGEPEDSKFRRNVRCLGFDLLPSKPVLVLQIRQGDGTVAELAAGAAPTEIAMFPPDGEFELVVCKKDSRSGATPVSRTTRLPIASFDQGSLLDVEFELLPEIDAAAVGLTGPLPRTIKASLRHHESRPEAIEFRPSFATPSAALGSWSRADTGSRAVPGDPPQRSRRILFRGDHRFLGVAVVGSFPLRNRVVARRVDDRRSIGAHCPSIPLFLAFADGRTSLELEVDTSAGSEPASFRAIALSGPRDPRAALFLEILGLLGESETERGPPTAVDLDDAVAWTSAAFAVSFTREEVATIRGVDAAGAELADQLERLGLVR